VFEMNNPRNALIGSIPAISTRLCQWINRYLLSVSM
jgi:hypothetical protein